MLHDLDYDLTLKDPERHRLTTAELLAGRGVDPAVLQAIRAHAHGERTTRLDKALFATDRLTGLIVAGALIHPTKKLASIDAEFMLHRFEEKRFAPGANRDGLRMCAEFDLTLKEFVSIGAAAMQRISGELGL